ncbi:hypothetical protein G7067_10090 [Leucobacter insecticola]|uniref:Uncharacterized protein n=1 Tax=Leucobacter insecticola TaxID=2714934 RepID=A0A6G8FJQ3_9MICO|nr:hypothetical protein [Leucobacter insecticola]QIM16676.1 hypothetical protein G7067_10090 [Leucobacter insecticola]
MVDLHQQEPGLPNGHPWLALSRWGMAWRVGIGALCVGMLGSLLLALTGFGVTAPGVIFAGQPALLFGVLPAAIFGGLAAVLGPWLRRYYPFSQALIFGFLGVAACTVILVVLDVADQLSSTGCLPEDGCARMGFGSSFLVIMFAGLPLALMAGVGLALAIQVAGVAGRAASSVGSCSGSGRSS